MQTPGRNIHKKLWALRLTILAGAGFILTGVFWGYPNQAYFAGVILIFMSFIVVEDIIFYEKRYEVKKYYFFGLFCYTWSFGKGDNIISGGTYLFGTEGDPPDFSMEHETGCLFTLVAIFLPKPKISRVYCRIETKDEYDTIKKSVGLYINQEEYLSIKKLQETLINPSSEAGSPANE